MTSYVSLRPQAPQGSRVHNAGGSRGSSREGEEQMPAYLEWKFVAWLNTIGVGKGSEDTHSPIDIFTNVRHQTSVGQI